MRKIVLALIAVAAVALQAGAADLSVSLPLGRTAYQTNEQVDVSVVRSSADGLQAGDLVLTLSSEDGSQLEFSFPVKAADGNARVVKHLRVNGWLLRPGKYLMEANADGATATTQITVKSHIRKTNYKLIHWSSRAKGREQAFLGEDSMGLNLIYAAYGGLDPNESILGGLDYIWCCTMSGGAQMDLRRECDWSDPYVLGGGKARLAQRTFRDRTHPNCLGVHFYDEPTLTSWQHPATKENVHFNVPAQDEAYRATFGKEPIQYNEVDPNNPEDVARFEQMNRWRLELLEAAWKLCKQTVNYARPDYLTANQGSWLFSGFGAGYYFNFQRCLPVYSGHGGYDYLYGGHYAPGYFFELGRARDFNKPEWYLPHWYDRAPGLWRAEQYMSFIYGAEGMAIPPDVNIHKPSTLRCSESVVETNKMMGRIGTVFTTMPDTKPDVAVLFSLSHALRNMTNNPKDTYYAGEQWPTLLGVYMATKMLQVPMWAVVEEDVLDGSLAADHKALIVAGITYLEPEVIAALEQFIANGGEVLVSSNSTVKIKGSKTFEVSQKFIQLHKDWDNWARTGQWGKWNLCVVTHGAYREALDFSKSLKTVLNPIGIKPVFECDEPGIVASREAWGDVEYLLATNATPNPEELSWYGLKAVEATIAVPADGRPVYDAVAVRPASEFEAEEADQLVAKLRFGPGQLRVLARTARPIGGVQVLTPVVFSNFTASLNPVEASAPLKVELQAVVVDDQRQVLNGSIPMKIEMTDPLGVVRYELLRATENGVLKLELPLAANDPPGQWTVAVTELLSGRQGEGVFAYDPPSRPGSGAGEVRRAVYFGNERDNVFRFFRLHKDIAIVAGSSDYDQSQAERLVEILAPWDIRAEIVPMAEAAKPRELTAEQQPTWVGINGSRNPDFALAKPAILLGNPGDNTLIKFLNDQGWLPYRPSLNFPGPGRGMIAWQTDGVRFFNGETITLIAYDEAGMAEAVGTLFSMMSGATPLTPLEQPKVATLTPASRNLTPAPEPQVAWQMEMPDRFVKFVDLPNDEKLVLSFDGTLTRIQANGSIAWQKPFYGSETMALDASADGSLIALGTSNRIYGINADGSVRFQVPLNEQQYNPIVTAIAVSPDGSKILASGGLFYWDPWRQQSRLRMLSADGTTLWTIGGLNKEPEAKPVLPAKYIDVAFSGSGNRLLLTTKDDLRIRDAANGKQLAVIKDVNGSCKPYRATDDIFILSDGKGKMAAVSATELKVIDSESLPNAGINTFDVGPSGAAFGTETDGTVRFINPDRQIAWSDEVHAKVVKQVAVTDRRVAVSYWGGTVRVYDTAGNLLNEVIYNQDISTIGWQGEKIILGIADGRLLGLAVR